MKIKVFQTNPNGKIEFTPAELEKLLNDTFAEGQKECNCNKTITWTNPYLTQPLYYQDEKTTTTCASSNDEGACECANPQRKAYTATININSEDAKEMSKHIDEIIKNAVARIDNDVFSKLAKELDF